MAAKDRIERKKQEPQINADRNDPRITWHTFGFDLWQQGEKHR
jgi:hypothetical protein